MSLGSRQHDNGDTKDLLCHLAVMQQSGAHHTGCMESDSPPPIWFGGAAALPPHVVVVVVVVLGQPGRMRFKIHADVLCSETDLGMNCTRISK